MSKPRTAKQWKAAGLNPQKMAALFYSRIDAIKTATDSEIENLVLLAVRVIERLTRPRGKPSDNKTKERARSLFDDAFLHGECHTWRESLERAASRLSVRVLGLVPRRRGRQDKLVGLGIIWYGTTGLPSARRVADTALRIQKEQPTLGDKQAVLAALIKHGATASLTDHLDHYRKRFSDKKRGRRR